MTRIVLAFMLSFALQAVYADVLIIDEVRQAETMQLPKNGQDKATVESKFGTPAKRLRPWETHPFPAGNTIPIVSILKMTLVLFTVLHSGAVIEK